LDPKAIKYIRSISASSSASSSAPSPDNYIYFYYPGRIEVRDDRVYGAFGNFFEKQFTFNGIQFKCAESAFQSEKVPDHVKHAFSNLNGNDAITLARQKGQRLKNNVATMYNVLRVKFQDPEMMKLLQKSKPKILVEANTRIGRDKIYSNNKDGTGYNILGLLLMHIRDRSNDELVQSLLQTGLWVDDTDTPKSTVYDSQLFPRTMKLLKDWRKDNVRPTP
jgi:predicted NAD-dependent protein-ADP-ribosyltransferase YbiA (DUF1768 family)